VSEGLNELLGSSLHDLAGLGKMVRFLLPALALLTPELLHLVVRGVVEENPVGETVHGRHEFLVRRRGDFIEIESIGAFGGHVDYILTRRQDLHVRETGGNATVGDDIVSGRNEEVVRLMHEVGLLQIRQGKDLGLILHRLGLLDHLVVRLADEGDDGAIAVNGPAFNVGDVVAATIEGWHFDIGKFPTLLRENLHTHVEGVIVEMVIDGL
jgi:hypothetical protein